MGRPSQIGMTARVSGGKLTEIRIRGRAIRVAQGRIHIPKETP